MMLMLTLLAGSNCGERVSGPLTVSVTVGDWLESPVRPLHPVKTNPEPGVATSVTVDPASTFTVAFALYTVPLTLTVPGCTHVLLGVG